MEHRKIGFAFCGSFCTYSQAMEVLERVQSRYGDVLPIVSEAGAATDIPLRGGPRLYAGDGAHLRPEGDGQHRQGRALGPGICWMCWSSVPARQHPGQAGKRRHGHHGYHGGPRLTCATGAGWCSALPPTTVCGLGQEYRRTAGQEKRLFRPLPAGRSRHEAHLPGGRLFPGPSRYRRGAGGPPAPARAAWTAGGGLKNTPPPGVAGGGVFCDCLQGFGKIHGDIGEAVPHIAVVVSSMVSPVPVTHS